MATTVATLRDMLRREINIPGFEQLPDITGLQLDSYILDAFWESRLLGMLGSYSVNEDGDIAGPGDSDLPQWYQQLVTIVAGLRIIRMKMLNLAINFSAKAGPVEYEQQASATTLRAVFGSLEDRLKMVLSLHSDELGASAIVYFDGALQRESSLLHGYLDVQVL